MTIETFKDYFVGKASTRKNGNYATIFIMRKAESECIFRTDKEISNEVTLAGMVRRDDNGDGGAFTRVYLSKRKVIAPERRTGREMLRKLGLLNKGEGGEQCSINSDKMCGKCIDCRLYGSAIGSKLSLKSHVVSDEAFSLLSYDDVTDEHTFNALLETGTMVNEDGTHNQALGTDEVVRPGTIFLDIETISDVTMDEFIYILGNILRTKRYGAMSSRIGKMSNTILGIAFSNCELFSNLEWTQSTYDATCANLGIPENQRPAFPLDPAIVAKVATETMKSLVKGIHGSVELLGRNEVCEIIDQVSGIFADKEKLASTFKKIT
jgi:CRISPR-associated protein Csc2